MKKYVLLYDTDKVQEIIPEFVAAFPNITITERYSAEFIDQLIEIDESVEVEQNWLYDPTAGTFGELLPEEEVDE